jgi:hypothetical protein|tara:strand:- start:268 stop:846 length:579 start_codon:yes stop_codon:yes gene_type:complete
MAEKKKAGRIRKGIDKIRKKIAPTFGEQFAKARKEGKKEFKSTRDDTKKGKLRYSTMTKKEVAKKIAAGKRDDAKVQPNAPKKQGTYEKATGTKLSAKGKAFRDARKAGKKEFTFEGKKYTTRLKGEKEKKPLITGKGFFGKKINISKPELSGKTSKKIKKAVRGDTTGFDIQGARKGGLIRGIPKLARKGF